MSKAHRMKKTGILAHIHVCLYSEIYIVHQNFTCKLFLNEYAVQPDSLTITDYFNIHIIQDALKTYQLIINIKHSYWPGPLVPIISIKEQRNLQFEN